MWEDNKHHKSSATNQKQLFHVIMQTWITTIGSHLLRSHRFRHARRAEEEARLSQKLPQGSITSGSAATSWYDSGQDTFAMAWLVSYFIKWE